MISGTGQQRANRPGSLPVLQWTMPCMRRRVVRRVVFSPMIAREAIDIPAQERIEQPLCRMRSDALGVQSRLFRVPFARIQDRARSCAGRLSITAMPAASPSASISEFMSANSFGLVSVPRKHRTQRSGGASKRNRVQQYGQSTAVSTAKETCGSHAAVARRCS